MAIIVNACCYCGKKADGNYSIERDGFLSNQAGAPQVPLCDEHGAHESPSLQEIWARVSMADDDGTEWGPRQGPCSIPPAGMGT